MQTRKIKRQAQTRKITIWYSQFRKILLKVSAWMTLVLSLMQAITANTFLGSIFETALGISIAICCLLIVYGPSEPTKEEINRQTTLDRMKPTKH